jgi:pyocin large subunit-like protein
MKKTALIVLSLLASACSDGSKLADVVGSLGSGGTKDCAGSVAASAADHGAPAAVAVAAAEAKPTAAEESTSTTTLSPAVREAIRDAVREAVGEIEKSARASAGASAAAAASADEPVPAAHHRRGSSQAVSVPVHRSTARVYDNHDNFRESTAPEEYRLPPSGQILVPREGQSVLNGPNHEGVPPPNSNPIRLPANSGWSG